MDEKFWILQKLQLGHDSSDCQNDVWKKNRDMPKTEQSLAKNRVDVKWVTKSVQTQR